jgi:hypothetical protein
MRILGYGLSPVAEGKTKAMERVSVKSYEVIQSFLAKYPANPVFHQLPAIIKTYHIKRH